MLIAIPSKGRPTGVTSKFILSSASVFVPEYEYESYKKAGVRNLMPVPASVKGITPTRNWILNNTDEPHVVFVDDDVKKAGWINVLPNKMECIKMTEKEWIREFVRLFDITEQMGGRVFGLATMSAPRAVYPYKPFMFRSYLTASCMGMLNKPDFRFDERFVVKEDYELGLRCIKEDGFIVGARYLFWENSHWTYEGGCKDYRTQKNEMDAINRLKEMYPGMIRRVTRGGSNYSIHLEF